MADATIRFFPVGNGDCTLLWVGETRILIDLSPRIKVGDPHFDLEETKEALLPLLEREDGRYVVDAFILSHPDKDHLLYAEDLFHLGAPEDYDPESKNILVEEICYAPASFVAVNDPMSDDAKAVGKEIERRLLSSDNRAGNLVSAFLEPDADDPGADRTFSPGDEIDSFGASGSDDRLSAVVYGPRGVLDPQNRNEVSAIVQMRVAPEGSDTPVRIILGGDAPWEVWKDIAETEDLGDFTYDLLLAPHHCSWTTFAEQGDDADEEVKDLFGHAQPEAKVVASCFAIDSDRNPPSEEAAKIYRDLVGEDNFFCTGEYPSKEEHRPIVFEITGTGVQETDPEDRDATGGAAAKVGAIRRTPQRYGCDR